MKFSKQKLEQAYNLLNEKFDLDLSKNINQEVTRLIVYPNNNPMNGRWFIEPWASKYSAVSQQEDFRIELTDRDGYEIYEYVNLEDLLKTLKRLCK